MSPRLQSALILAGMFTLGAITGGAAVHLLQAKRGHSMFEGPGQKTRVKGMIAALDREVNLDDAQREKVREIVSAHEPELKEIRRAAAPRLAAVHAKIVAEVRAVLRPEQMASFDQFVKKQEEREVP